MQPTDALLALAQFSLALAGFTGVVIAFGWRDDEWHAADAFRTWRALVTSLACAFLSLVPIALDCSGWRARRCGDGRVFVRPNR
jgi:hypothetical protein